MAREVKYIDPATLVIVGIDCEEDGSPLNDERAAWEVAESMVKNVKPASARLTTSARVFRWSASAPQGSDQPSEAMPSRAACMTSAGVRPVRSISRTDC